MIETDLGRGDRPAEHAVPDPLPPRDSRHMGCCIFIQSNGVDFSILAPSRSPSVGACVLQAATGHGAAKTQRAQKESKEREVIPS